jgi:hypothetical protein
VDRPFSKWLPSGNFYGTESVRPKGDFFRLMVAAIVVIFAMIAVMALEALFKR